MTDTAAAVAAFLAAKKITRVETGARAMSEGQIYAATRDAKPKVTILGDAFPDDHAAAVEFLALLPMLATIARGLGSPNYRHVSYFTKEYEMAMHNFRKNQAFTPMKKIIKETIKWLVTEYHQNAAGVTDEQAETLSAFNRKMGFDPIW